MQNNSILLYTYVYWYNQLPLPNTLYTSVSYFLYLSYQTMIISFSLTIFLFLFWIPFSHFCYFSFSLSPCVSFSVFFFSPLSFNIYFYDILWCKIIHIHIYIYIHIYPYLWYLVCHILFQTGVRHKELYISFLQYWTIAQKM